MSASFADRVLHFVSTEVLGVAPLHQIIIITLLYDTETTKLKLKLI